MITVHILLLAALGVVVAISWGTFGRLTYNEVRYLHKWWPSPNDLAMAAFMLALSLVLTAGFIAALSLPL